MLMIIYLTICYIYHTLKHNLFSVLDPKANFSYFNAERLQNSTFVSQYDEYLVIAKYELNNNRSCEMYDYHN